MRLLEAVLGFLVVLAAVLRREPARRPPPGVDAEDLAAGYERSDAHVGWIVTGGVVLLAALALVVVAASSFETRATGLPVSVGPPPDLVNRLTPQPTPPPPRLEVQEGEDLATYRAVSEQRLTSYGWIDRQAGLVRIPIERAMDITAQQGLPARASSAARDTGATSPSAASSGRVDEQVSP